MVLDFTISVFGFPLDFAQFCTHLLGVVISDSVHYETFHKLYCLRHPQAAQLGVQDTVKNGRQLGLAGIV